jgi:exopolysaccharide biosynthesis WecB/TagA/CpsF family protein
MRASQHPRGLAQGRATPASASAQDAGVLEQVDILGVTVTSGSSGDVVRHLDGRIARGEVTRVAFLNAHLSNVVASDGGLRSDLRDFLILNDGVGVDVARYLLHGERFPENLNGTDLITEYLDRSEHRLRIFLLGAKEDALERAARRIAERWPQHEVVGRHHGYFDAQSGDRVGRMILDSKPSLLLVAMGNPRQERWIAEHVPQMCRTAIAVGAWFDFVAGEVPRAPMWVRKLRSEWVFRLLIEPRRLAKRYLVGNLVFLARLGLARSRRRRSGAEPA